MGLSRLAFIVVLAAVILPAKLGEARYFGYFYPKRMAEEQNSGGCVSPPGMNRQLRSGSLNIYLNEMLRCLASSARPRFGKRGGVQAMELPNSIEPPSSKVKPERPQRYDVWDILRRLNQENEEKK